MSTASLQDKKRLRELKAQLKELQANLAVLEKYEGKDPYIAVKVTKNQARSQKLVGKKSDNKGVGKFFIEIAITAKQQVVFVPISIASGKKTAGFMYHIEGTAEGSLATTECTVLGKEISQITLGTLLFAKIPVGQTAYFHILASINGKRSKQYKIIITRLNYKLSLSDLRYLQYLKEIHSENAILE